MGLLAEKFMDYVSAPEDDELQEDRGLYGTSTDAFSSPRILLRRGPSSTI